MGFTNLGGLKIYFGGLTITPASDHGISRKPFTSLAKDRNALISWGVDWVVGVDEGCRGWGLMGVGVGDWD